MLFVFTVRILSGVKRSASSHGHSKGATTKRSYLSESQSSITHTGSPVNPMTAKALASKLNERNNMLNGARKSSTQVTNQCNGTANDLTDLPVPPLVCIQTTSGVNRTKECDESHNRKYVQARKMSGAGAHCKTNNNAAKEKVDSSHKKLNGASSITHSKAVNRYRLIKFSIIFNSICNSHSSISDIECSAIIAKTAQV